MKRTLFLLVLWLTVGAGVITAVPAFAQTEPSRLVIKNGELQLLVENTDTAVQTALRLLEEVDGYVLSQEIHEDDGRNRYATIKIGVPADRFERLLSNFKTLGSVLDELLTGEDLTDTAVDLDSRLDNLYANQDRIRLFIDQTNYMTETLDVHDQLVRVENEIGELQGQKNYLSDRAATATLTLRLLPVIPTPTPIPTATPTPIPPAKAWNPADTAQLATLQLTETSQSVADIAIYRFVIWLPWFIFLTVVGFILWQFRRRKQQARTVANPSVLDASLKESDSDN